MTQDLEVIIDQRDIRIRGQDCILTTVDGAGTDWSRENPTLETEGLRLAAYYPLRLGEAYAIFMTRDHYTAIHGTSTIISTALTQDNAYRIIKEIAQKTALTNAKEYSLPITDRTIPAWMQDW